MTFSQIPYVRADLTAWQEKYIHLTERFKAAQTFEEADAIYYEACTCDAAERENPLSARTGPWLRGFPSRQKYLGYF